MFYPYIRALFFDTLKGSGINEIVFIEIKNDYDLGLRSRTKAIGLVVCFVRGLGTGVKYNATSSSNVILTYIRESAGWPFAKLFWFIGQRHFHDAGYGSGWRLHLYRVWRQELGRKIEKNKGLQHRIGLAWPLPSLFCCV